MPDSRTTKGSDFFGQNTHSILEVIGVANLIASAKVGDFLAAKVNLIQFVVEAFPVGLEFTNIPGRAAHNQTGIVSKIIGASVGNVVECNNAIAAKFGLDSLG